MHKGAGSQFDSCSALAWISGEFVMNGNNMHIFNELKIDLSLNQKKLALVPSQKKGRWHLP